MELHEIIRKRWQDEEDEKLDGREAKSLYRFARNDVLDLLDKIDKLTTLIQEARDTLFPVVASEDWGDDEDVADLTEGIIPQLWERFKQAVPYETAEDEQVWVVVKGTSSFSRAKELAAEYTRITEQGGGFIEIRPGESVDLRHGAPGRQGKKES